MLWRRPPRPSLRREPRGDAEQVNSVALGGPLRLLRPARSEDITTRTYGRRAGNRREPDGPVTRPDEWFLAQSSEGYVGFVHKNDIRFTDDFRVPEAYLDRPTTLTLPNGRKIVAPCGASLYRGVDGKWWVGGVDVELPHDTLSAPGRDIRLTSQTLVERAQPLLGTQYVWGGVTEEGIDCSGFTQFLFKTYGIVLPRDAEEQAIVGQIVAFGQDVVRTAQPGDLIFFMNEHGKVNHVAISLGGGPHPTLVRAQRALCLAARSIRVERRTPTGSRVVGTPSALAKVTVIEAIACPAS
ncbi:MAG: hypothetical protein KatS3mg130_1440 [Candidatus Sumerlaea sp.]|nr:MAG: hypothetical protein KatS3mg130_1440 [Candidatus Sumerlaea sp.]